MVIVTLLVMYPLSVLLSTLLQPVMAIAPPILAPLVMMGVMIPLVTYVVMPLAMRVFSRWLFPGAARN
jgi:antibiotic biosynthesis monooxygenase (ABM) superfamily enzyme